MLQTSASVAGFRIESVLDPQDTGSGVVYEATRRSDRRRVALKVFRTDLSGEPSFSAAFRRQVTRVGTVHSPHLVPVYEAGRSERGLYFAMRLIRGPTLRQVMVGGDLGPRRLLRVLAGVAEALDALHSKGLIHGDVKPDKILLEESDPALSVLVGFAPAPEGGWLAPSYASPEQLRGEPASSRSDVYALAAVTYEALAGAPPASGGRGGERPPIRPSLPELPGELADVLERAMSSDPAARHASAGALVSELEEGLASHESSASGGQPARRESAQAGEAIAPHASSERRVTPELSRRWAILVAVLLAGALAAGGGWYLAQRSASDVDRPAAKKRGAVLGVSTNAQAVMLGKVMNRLERRRAALLPALRRAKSPHARMSAAGDVQRAYQAAVAALTRPSLTTSDRRAYSPVVAALQRSAAAYGRIAAAPEGGSLAAAEADARRSDRALRREVERLDAAGYLPTEEF